MNVQSGLVACGAVAVLAVAVAAAGCGSSASSAPGASAGGSTAGSAGSAAGATASPSWASALGSGVTIYAPGSASPGNGSPGAVAAGIVAAENSGDYTSACNYYVPSLQSSCTSQMSAAVSASPSAVASAIGHASNFGIGYVAVHGNDALVGTTGTFCSSGSCFTNSDPAALLSSGKSFAALWTAANGSSNSNAYSLAPVTEVGGKWYLYSPSSS